MIQNLWDVLFYQKEQQNSKLVEGKKHKDQSRNKQNRDEKRTEKINESKAKR